jgi:hypothetical protein
LRIGEDLKIRTISRQKKTQDFGRLTTEEKVDILPGSLDEKLLTLWVGANHRRMVIRTSASAVRITSDL